MRIRTAIIIVFLTVGITQSFPIQMTSKGESPMDVKMDLVHNVTWESEYKFYTGSGVGCELYGGGGDGSILHGNLSDLFSGNEDSFEWNLSHNYISAGIEFHFESIKKITRIRVYPLGNTSEISKLGNFTFRLASQIGTKYVCGTDAAPIVTSATQTPDQHFEYDFSDLTADYIRINIFPYRKAQPCYSYYWNEIEIYYDPSYSPFQNNITNQNITNQNITNVTLQNITQVFNNHTYQNLSYNDTLLWENLSMLLRDYVELMEALTELNKTVSSGNGNITIFQNNTVISQWEELNRTLENITVLQYRIAIEENRTIATGYNDTELLRRMALLENRNSTNTVIFNNRTIMSGNDDSGMIMLGGVLAGAGTGAAVGIYLRYSGRKKKED